MLKQTGKFRTEESFVDEMRTYKKPFDPEAQVVDKDFELTTWVPWHWIWLYWYQADQN